MASKNREIIKLKSTESSEMYWTVKNKRKTTGRLELKKYDKKLRKHGPAWSPSYGQKQNREAPDKPL